MKKKPNARRAKGISTRGLICLLLWSLAFLGSAVYLTVDVLFSPRDRGDEVVVVPEFRGACVPNAEEYASLELTVEYRYDASVPEGIVISQSPAAGSRRRLGGELSRCPVTLFVSLGEGSELLPDVCGMPQHTAELRLRELGFSVVSERKESSYPEGEVYATSPHAGVRLPRGSEIRLTVSDGVRKTDVAVPSLCGLQRSEALVRLWMARLSAIAVEEVDSLAPPGEVVSQSPPAGARVIVGSGVRLYVSRGEMREKAAETE